MLGYSGNVNVGYFKVIANTGQITLNAYPKALTTDTGSGNVISDTNWHHIAATMQGDENGAIYIDGVATALSINTIDRNIILDILGARGDNASEHFDGLLNDVRVYNRALTANEVSQLYNSGNPQPDVIDASAIVHWWKGDDATGSTLTDVIGANNGTIDGATWTNAVIKASDGSTDYNFSLSGGNGETVMTFNHAMIDSNAGAIRMDNNKTHTFNDVFFNGSKLRPFSSSSSYQDITLNRCRFGEATGGSNIIRAEGGAIDVVMNNCRLNHGSNSSAFRIGNSHLTLNDCIFEGSNFGSGSAPGFNGTNTILISDQAQIVIVDPKTSYTDVSRDRCIFISPSNGSTSSTHFGIYSALQGVAGFTQDKNVRFEDIYGSRSPFFKISTNNLQCKSLFIGADVTVEVTEM
jgi:hypothetical protein